MLIFLLACAQEGDEPATVPSPEAVSGGTILLGVSEDVADPLVVELNAKGESVWELHVKSLFGQEWEAMERKPLLMDVQPVAGGSILLSLYGVGIIEIDRAGAVLWRHDDGEASHDVDRLANGNTLYARTWAAEGEPAVVEVDRAGSVVWSWSGEEAFGSNALFAGYRDEQDAWMHPTAVQRLEDGTTSVCMRNFNMVVLLDGAGKVTRQISFRAPEGAEGPATKGNLQGLRPHGAEWVPGAGLSVALRSPDRALALKDGQIMHEYRGEGVEGITDVDVAADGGMLIAAHRLVQEVDAQGAVVWEWAVPAEAGASAEAAARHIFNTISRIDANGAPIDFD